MGLDLLLFDFLERIAMGAATVFALLLAVGLRMPRRSPIVISRKPND